MKAPANHSSSVRLERAVIAFFSLAALSLLVVYVADPAIYARSLALTSSPADRYPVQVTLFLAGILDGITLLIIGVLHHWRWLFWPMLVAFSCSALQVPVTLLQIAAVLPSSDPVWYGLLRIGSAAFELALAVWMIRIYRHEGVWALGKKRHER